MTTTQQTPFRYFVSFNYMEGSSFGCGNMMIPLLRPVYTMDDVNILARIITDHGHRNVVVLSFCLFTEPPVAQPASARQAS
jgi:hypothetical protein